MDKEIRKEARKAFAYHGGFAIPKAFLEVFADVELTKEQVWAIARAHEAWYLSGDSFAERYPKNLFFLDMRKKMIGA